MSLLSKFRTVLMKRPPRLRDRRGHYASSALNCLRDQYWSLTGEPETNPTDYLGAFRMMMGDAFEWAVREHVFRRMSPLGEHFLAAQVTTGGSNPDWNGYQDLLMASQAEDGSWQQYVIELKAKFGVGADFLLRDLTPQEGHVIQLGLYLKDMKEKLNHNTGILLYGCISDRSIGSLVGFECHYDEATTTVHVTKATVLECRQGQDEHFFERRVEMSLNLEERALSRWRQLDEYLAAGKVPPGEYQYKWDLSPEMLRSKDERGYYKVSDTKLLSAIEKGVILGDWQVKYSSYKDKQVDVDGLSQTYTPEEIAMLKSEYRRRKPNTRKF